MTTLAESNLATLLARELFRYDQGFAYEIDDPDPEVQQEYEYKLAYVTETFMPLIMRHCPSGP